MLIHCRIISALIGGFALTLAVALNANASPITFSFSAAATSGPLDGITENGAFTYDSSSIIPGGLNDNTGLLTGLNFTWNGITYNQTTANTGSLAFDSSGNLTEAFFGDNCIASQCTVQGGTNEWSLFAVPGETTTPPFGFTYATPSTGFTTALSPIPEHPRSRCLALALPGSCWSARGCDLAVHCCPPDEHGILGVLCDSSDASRFCVSALVC